MARRVFDSETWIKIGQPDLNSKLFFKDKNGNKIWGVVTMINYSHKKGVELNIQPFINKNNK